MKTTDKMHPTETGKILDTDIYAVRDGFVNAYFIKTKKGYLLFDAGKNIENFKKILREIKINTNDVKLVFLTHSHYDHVAGLALFTNAKIYICENELPLFNKKQKRDKTSKITMNQKIDISNIIPLSNNQEISFNRVKVKCLAAPGHTIGSMIYLVDNKYLITGDTLLFKDGKVDVHTATKDNKLAKETIEQLKEIIYNSSIVLTSHFGIKVN
jgi:glyoxylase-like metal-dependent hydrolase (beta-lactamase superfamily II)